MKFSMALFKWDKRRAPPLSTEQLVALLLLLCLLLLLLSSFLPQFGYSLALPSITKHQRTERDSTTATKSKLYAKEKILLCCIVDNQYSFDYYHIITLLIVYHNNSFISFRSVKRFFDDAIE